MEARQPVEQKKYTYEDYMEWPEDFRAELIDGEIYALASPTGPHQRVKGRLFTKLDVFLEGKTCVPFDAPYDLRFVESKRAKDVVQPDIMVVCDPKKIHNECIIGAPDLIIEVLSPGTAVRDFNKKKELYERNGVKEYWLVSPPDRVIYQFKLVNDQYEDTVITQGRIESYAIEGFGFALEELFSVLSIFNQKPGGEGM